MMGRRGEQWSLFYQFRLDERVPKDHLLRRIDGFVTTALADIHERLEPYYSEIGRPSVDPKLMIRMLIVGYCYGLRSERRLTQEVELHLAYRWFSRLDLDDRVPHHSTFSENRLHRFRDSDVFRHVFERVVATCMAAGLVKGEGFAVDASVMEANASRYHGKAPDEIVWAEPERQTRAVKEYLAALDADVEPNPDRKPPKVISPSDPCSAWTAKANKRVQFGYGLNYLDRGFAAPVRHILGQVAPRFDLAFTMNNRRILIANLAKGTIGEQAANLLGSLLVSHLQFIAMERGALPPAQRIPFFAHVDEMQTLSSDAFASLLSESRKFALHFCLANQFTDQLASAVCYSACKFGSRLTVES